MLIAHVAVADCTVVHVIKKIKNKNKFWKLFFKFKISENKFKNHKKKLKIKIFQNLIF